MLIPRVLAILTLCTLATASAAGPVLPKPALVAAAVESATDNIGSGWCGRGMLSILKNAGLGTRLQGGNGQDWEKILVEAGWRAIRCNSPLTAPLGSVLVYLGDGKVGKPNRGTPGGSFGHVEMVALGTTGQRLYVSDSPRARPGGSVPDNFTGRAWVPPGAMTAKAPPVEDQIESILEERKRLAMERFSHKNAQANGVQLASTSR